MFFLVFLLLFPCFSQAKTSEKIYFFVVSQNYEQAYNTLDSLLKTSPQNAELHFLKAFTLQSEMADFEDFSKKELFFNSIQKAKNFSENNPFWQGKTDFLEGIFDFKQKKYFSACFSFKKGAVKLEKVLETDSLNCEALLDVGIFYYFESELLSYVPFVENKKTEAKRLLEKVLNSGSNLAFASGIALSWIFLWENETEKAYSLLVSFEQKFPENRLVLWCKAEVCKKLGKKKEALEIYKRLESFFSQKENHSEKNLAVLKKNILDLKKVSD
ncbi:hypothetical protein IT568_08185 [bacterium]|nr:hypothetical protein [bacterium]